MEAHQHEVVYYGVVNLVHNEKIIGAVDVWRCRTCAELFCEDKRFGATDLAPEVGFPKIEAGSKWAALICTRNNNSNWTLTAAKPGTTLTHSCTPETKLELKVGPDYSLEPGPVSGVGQHRIILLDSFVNSAVDVATGQKHLGTTDAYQALGKPFSFTPPLSAAVVQSSKLGVFHLASTTFLLTGILALLGVITASGIYENIGLRTLLVVISLSSFVGSYFTYRKKLPGPLLGVGTAILGLAAYTSVRLMSGTMTPIDYFLGLFLVAEILAGWTATSRIRSLRAKRWHPLDMPAYG